MPFHIALVGNPNCGKTTFFNELTGSSQYVGNWPGVTVEKKEGKLLNKSTDAVVVDLPGIYSLSPYTPEEIVTRNYIINEEPDLIINIIDATNIERNLYLSTQLAELGKPMLIALNMMDMLKGLGISIDLKKLENELGVPVYPISASKNVGTKELVHKAIHVLHDIAHTKLNNLSYCDEELKRADDIHMHLHSVHPDLNENYHEYMKINRDFYSDDVTVAINMIESAICKYHPDRIESARFSAVKLFEDDPVTEKFFKPEGEFLENINKAKSLIPLSKNVDRQMIIADQRYKFICNICQKAVKKENVEDKLTISDKIDKIVTNRFLALPVFFLIMFGIFYLTFGPVGSFLTDFVDKLINEQFAGFVRTSLENIKVANFAVSLVCDGMIAGVGAVLTFFPQILILFFCLSLLEDSGYMARAAFIMDKLLGKLGLSGKSFVPILMGFGCSVPAILSTRTLENEKDKRLTIMLIPFMSCPAKTPIYLVFISAFFPHHKALIMFSLYLMGIVVAILLALILKKTILKGERGAFVMELPPYRMPTLKNLWIHVSERAKDFLVRAGTILLAASIIIWFLRTFDFSFNMVADGKGSIIESIGKFIAPIFTPCGFNSWESSVALISGLVAKESVVSTLGVLTNKLVSIFPSALSAFGFLTFTLLYTPCIAALSATYKEMHSKKWFAFAVILQLFVAYIVSVIVFQIGNLIF